MAKHNPVAQGKGHTQYKHDRLVSQMRNLARKRIKPMLEEGCTKREACLWIFRNYPPSLRKYYTFFIEDYWAALV